MKSINLVIIARNEARCIQRCIDSARPFVDEVILLDTGSTDDTISRAVAAGARVDTFVWTGHFSDARNAALALSDGDWNLVLDADEWIDSPKGWSDLRQSLSTPDFLGCIRIRNEINVRGTPGKADTWIARVLPRGVQYFGRIHEQPRSSLPERRLPVVVHHDGYTAERSLEKRERNLSLLHQALEEEPRDAYLSYQCGVQFEVAEDWDLACQFYGRSQDLGGYDQGFAHELGYRHLYCLKMVGQHEMALELGTALIHRWPNSADIHFAFGDLCLDLASRYPEKALDVWLPSAENSWLRCLEIGETCDWVSHIVGRGSHLAAHNLAVIYEGLGLAEQARRYRAMATAVKFS